MSETSQKAVNPGGHVIVSTFAPEGPTKCSGLKVMRYGAESLHSEFGMRSSDRESKRTPSHAVWRHTAVFVLRLQGRITRTTFTGRKWTADLKWLAHADLKPSA